MPRRFKNKITILAHPRGKAALAGASGQPSEIARAFLASGHAVVAFDPLFVGESLDPRKPDQHRPEVSYGDCYNPTRAADQMQDLATVVAWAKSRPDIDRVNVVAQGDAGYQVLVARPMLEGLSRTVIELSGMPPSRKTDEWPATIDLPGLEQFGGIKAAAALSAPAPLWLYGNVGSIKASWPRAAYELADSAEMLRIEPKSPTPEQMVHWVDEGR